MPCQIEIQEMELQLHIGCSEKERAEKQTVLATVRIQHYQKFLASKTDRVEDTINVSSVKKALSEHQFPTMHTLEFLGETLEKKLRTLFPQTGLVWELQLLKKNYGWKYIQSWST